MQQHSAIGERILREVQPMRISRGSFATITNASTGRVTLMGSEELTCPSSQR